LFIGAEISEEQSKKLPPDEVVKARVGSLWAQLAAGEKEKNHIPESDVRRWRITVARTDADGAYGASATEIREYRRLGEDEEISIGATEGDIDAQRVQLLRETRFFRRLQEGDEVAEGQLLGMINPSRAVDDLAIKIAKLHAAAADVETARKTRDEAFQRYQTAHRLNVAGKGIMSDEDKRGAELTWKRYIYETISKIQAVNVTTSELKQGQT